MSIQHLTTQRVTVPTVYVTKGRQRVKQYDNTIYLRNGDEFEIELFNPTHNKVLAKIDLNGKSLGSGIVLRPGERVFLERYFDEAKKFLFETYEVDGADPNVQQAIKMNGLVEVKFYDEYIPIVYNNTVTYAPYPYTYTGSPYNGITYTSGNAQISSAKGMSTANANAFFTSCNSQVLNEGNTRDFAPQETGRVEKGSNSDQSFMYDSTTFNTYYSWNATWKILPESQRPIMKEDLKVFCGECGSRRKRANHQFCSFCGTKF